MSKKLALLSLLAGAVTGVVIIVVSELLDIPPFAGLLVYVIPAVAWLVYCKLYVPRRYAHMLHKRLGKIADPTVAAPAGAYPADSEIIRRLLATREWEGKQLLLAKDFTIVDIKGRRFKRPVYRRLAAFMDTIYPQLDYTVEEILADPHAPGVFHVRERMTGRPHSGPPIDSTSWERYVLTPDGALVREISCTAVLSVA